MNLNLHSELEPTRAKLRLLEESYQSARLDRSGSPHMQELELRSLKQLINQLKEEISWHEAQEMTPAEVAVAM